MNHLKHFNSYIGFGVVGNFTNHLEQAGEAKDFIDVKVDEEKAPKGMFPFYQPNQDSSFLNTFPLSSDKIILPSIEGSKVQMEPEVALLCSLIYENHRVKDIKVKSFCAFNDCSIRVPNANKISKKKNWGENTKGISTQIIDIDKFEDGGVMDSYSIASFIKFDNQIEHYGNNSYVNTYSYFYNKLTQWMIKKLNTQIDFESLENLQDIVKGSKFTSNMIVSIGATSYTDFGATRFLQDGDEVFVVLYDATTYTIAEIEECIKNGNTTLDNASILHQYVVKPL